MDKKRERGVAIITSILLHSLLALLPWQEKPRPLAMSSTPASPSSPANPSSPASRISVVDASQLPTLPALESQPLPAAPSSPPVPSPAVDPPADLTPEPPIPETSEPLLDELPPETAPDADLTPEAPIPETNDSPIGGPAPEVPPGSDPVPATTTSTVTPADEEAKADWDHLVGYLQEQEEGFESFSLLDIFNFFGEPEQVNQFFDENNQPKLDVSSFHLFSEQIPEQVWEMVMPELASNTGFDLQPQENFASGLAYQLLQGEMLRYLIIVKLNEDSGSVLMLSDSLPELEP